MKRKILYMITIVFIAIFSFQLGRGTREDLDLSNKKDFEIACELIGSIVDWNTDGKELAIMTQDGYEMYAYKSENIYNQ